MPKAARRNFWKIINDNIRLHEELKTKKKEIARRHEELEKSVINSTDREKLEATKEEVGPRYVFQYCLMFLDLSTSFSSVSYLVVYIYKFFFDVI